jgi:CRP/FNR family cyclic AMP-dependent transcriptional regulator
MDEHLTAALASSRLFEGLSGAALDLVVGLAEEREFERGVTVFSEGEQGDWFYLLLEGRVRVTRSLGGLGDEVLAILDPGDVFGELSLIDGGERSATARTDERCRVLAFDRAVFEDFLLMRQDLAVEVLWNLVRVLGDRLRATNEKLVVLGSASRL